jgi:lactate dehydrogenase-like 2-hydroxyacid dehydrogenase
MYKQILALDLAHRVDNFSAKIKDLSNQESLVFNNTEDFLANKNSRENIDCLLVSIFQDINKSFLESLVNLKFIFVFGSSLKRIDLDFCKEKNIRVTNVTGYCDEETAEWIMLQILKHCRSQNLALSVNHKVLGLVGVGAVGREVFKRAQSFNMKILYNSSSHDKEIEYLGAVFSTKEYLFENSHIISFHTPSHLMWLTPELLQKCKAHTLVINSCFGEIISPHELIQVLKKRADLKMVMDSVAGASYEEAKAHVIIDHQAAYFTLEMKKRLADIFFSQLRAQKKQL